MSYNQGCTDVLFIGMHWRPPKLTWPVDFSERYMLTKFLIVEDHPLFADALQFAIRSVMTSVRFTHVSTLSAAKNAIRQTNDFGLVLLDLQLPDTQGLEGLLELRRLSPKLPIVIISALSDPSVAKAAMVCGAAGFISKGAPTNAVLQGIRDVLAGNVTFPGRLQLPRHSLATGELTTLTRRLNSLTRRQFDILQMLCQGLSNDQIARELHIQESTVRAHITGILCKLGVCSRTHAAAELSRLYLNPVRALYASEASAGSRRAAPRAMSNALSGF
jgi:DNA-binding NarL/FixJ family response regulator